ncbi:MAG TPA: FKBP-type peptidyl-prolyl cis-trans isomerase [Bacteroidales bacterium]|jgi:FKBP-type peptidyl-prolyl cis-trans isomerase SlyD|nr:FKBP-type peptidyl-prolyl cis-trans isomerase [Bacteroidales bacterium]MDD4235017.1 FKBP-type peptidyl-prolyl cis-trans isomerase [Bacteroidales bacterium]HRW20742.1 FKBP-type peptidyl-prolyl cis-trans isomerase [Bacteroidales bacterium]HXK81163.1 FKBP-type peptidyl-prolyl cis-trans isomerase [Bacteroidales bacterium]
MKIKKGSKVSIAYKLYLDGFDGELFETAEKDAPLVFKVGADEMLESFEEFLIGKENGEKFEFKIDMMDAYGPESEDSIGLFPHSVFADDDGKLPDLGDFVPMEDEDGNEYEAFVVEVTDDEVVLDFNHPLAGEDLYLKGEILNVE